ncbi:MAG TPA: glycosyltransferase family 4 protein, partial [Chloroflexota bacterium]
VAQLAGRMVRSGHTVEVLTESRSADLPVLERLDGVLVRRFTVPLTNHPYAVAPGLWWYLLTHRAEYDVVHAHNYHALPALSTVPARIQPLVFTPHYHGVATTRAGRLLHVPYRWIAAQIFRRSAAVICVSQWEAQLVGRHFPAVRDRITIIPNGVDVERIQAAAPVSAGKPLILTVGRLKGYKNVGRILEAMTHLEPGLRLVIAGDGPDRSALEQHARRLNLESRIRFLGHVPQSELDRWYRAARVFVTVSSEEAFGVTVLEALAAGARVVASDIPAHREVADLVGGVGMQLVAASAPATELAREIERALRAGPIEPDTLHLPRWSDVAAQTEAVYRSLVTKQRQPV